MQKIFTLLVVVIFFSSCQDAGTKEASQSEETHSAVINPDNFEILSSMPDAEVLVIDTSKSKIAWHCENHKGLVDLNGGHIFVRKDSPVGAYAEAITKSARDTSITYKLMKGTFNNVLQTADFFDSEHYPLLKFKTSNIQKENGQYSINGEISIRNINKPIQFKLASFRNNNGAIFLETEDVPINRTLFGMELNSRSFPKKAEDFIFSDTFFVKIVLATKGQ